MKTRLILYLIFIVCTLDAIAQNLNNQQSVGNWYRYTCDLTSNSDTTYSNSYYQLLKNGDIKYVSPNQDDKYNNQIWGTWKSSKATLVLKRRKIKNSSNFKRRFKLTNHKVAIHRVRYGIFERNVPDSEKGYVILKKVD